MNSTEFDVIVIGAGINGSWSALHLAKQGYKTVLIDQVYIASILIFIYIQTIFNFITHSFIIMIIMSSIHNAFFHLH